jgi:hypothetical protein
LFSLVIRIGRGTCSDILKQKSDLAYKDFTGFPAKTAIELWLFFVSTFCIIKLYKRYPPTVLRA